MPAHSTPLFGCSWGFFFLTFLAQSSDSLGGWIGEGPMPDLSISLLAQTNTGASGFTPRHVLRSRLLPSGEGIITGFITTY